MTATNNYSIVVNISAKAEKLKKELTTAQQLTEGLQKNITGFQEKTKSVLQGLQGLMMSVGLGFMFTGMAIKNFTQKLVAGLYETYAQIHGSEDSLVNSMDNVKAKIAYLKSYIISVGEEQGVFDKYFEMFDKLAQKIKDMPQEELGKLLDSVIQLVIKGAEMMIIGQTLLFLIGMFSLLAFLLDNVILVSLGAFVLAMTDSSHGANKLAAVLVMLGILAIGLALAFNASALAIPLLFIGSLLILTAAFVTFWDGIKLGFQKMGLIIGAETDTLIGNIIDNVQIAIQWLKKQWYWIQKNAGVPGAAKKLKAADDEITKLKEQISLRRTLNNLEVDDKITALQDEYKDKMLNTESPLEALNNRITSMLPDDINEVVGILHNTDLPVVETPTTQNTNHQVVHNNQVSIELPPGTTTQEQEDILAMAMDIVNKSTAQSAYTEGTPQT